jgi:hypothetical protein
MRPSSEASAEFPLASSKRFAFQTSRLFEACCFATCDPAIFFACLPISGQ